MSLSDLASLGSFVSGFAVLVSLIFLYFQLRHLGRQAVQSAKNQQALIRQARADRTVDLNLARMEPSATLAVEKGMRATEDISAVEVLQFFTFTTAGFYNWKETFEQYRAGLVDEVEFADFTANVRSLLAAPGMRARWRVQNVSLGKDFMDWMDGLVAETPPMARRDTLVRWKEAVAALGAGTSS